MPAWPWPPPGRRCGRGNRHRRLTRPARGPYAQLIGRSTAFLAGLPVDLSPAGWRLTDASSREHRLAISTLRADLDLLEEHAQDYAGAVKLSVGGPWTLAAIM